MKHKGFVSCSVPNGAHHKPMVPGGVGVGVGLWLLSRCVGRPVYIGAPVPVVGA